MLDSLTGSGQPRHHLYIFLTGIVLVWLTETGLAGRINWTWYGWLTDCVWSGQMTRLAFAYIVGQTD